MNSIQFIVIIYTYTVYSYLCNLVKLAKEFIQHMHKFTWRAVTGQPGEAHDVGIQNAAEKQEETTNNTNITAILNNTIQCTGFPSLTVILLVK